VDQLIGPEARTIRPARGPIIRGAGHPVAWLTCSAFNTRALGFYEHRGYTETRRDRFRQESGIDAEDVRLERRLDAPQS
jgi:hypothetical protein